MFPRLGVRDAIIPTRGIQPGVVPWVAGNWYSAYHCADMRSSGDSPTSDRLEYYPIFIAAPMRPVAALGIEVTAYSDAETNPFNYRLGLYTSRQGRPWQKVIDSGVGSPSTIAFHSRTASQFAFGTGQLVVPGWYFLAMVINRVNVTTLSIRTIDRAGARGFNLGIADATPPSDAITYLYQTHTSSGGVPDALPGTPGTLSAATGHPYRVLIRSA